MDIEEIRQRERDFIEAYHEITNNPYDLILFSIKGSGRHGQIIRLSPSQNGVFIVGGYSKITDVNANQKKKTWNNVNITGIFYQFFYSFRPVLIEYSKISRIETSTDRFADWLHIEYSTAKNKKLKASLFYYGINIRDSKHMPRYSSVPKSMRQKLINVISDDIREKLTI